MLDRRGFLRSAAGLLLTPFAGLERTRAGHDGREPAAPAGSESPSPNLPPWPADDDPRYWEKLRRQFYLNEDEVFFNTATLGSPPRVVVETVARSMRELAATIAQWDYKPDRPNWFTGYSPEHPIREKVARLVHAQPDEIALTQNATMGASFVAMGLDLGSGDEVIQTDQEHVGNKSSWETLARRRGIVWKTLALPVPANDPEEIVSRVRAAITPRTRVIAWPHVTSQLGTVNPVREICALARERGLFSAIDGAQAVGQIPVDVREIGCDAYYSSPHKWLLAPAGNGFLFVRREIASRVWTTLASGEWGNEKDPGYRLQQRGTGNLSLLLGFEAAIDFFDRVGPDRWFARIRQLGDHLRDALGKVENVRIFSSTEPRMCAGMTTWRIEGLSPYRTVDLIWERSRLRPRAVSEAWGIRTSTCVYNSEKEIDRLVAVARQLAKERPD